MVKTIRATVPPITTRLIQILVDLFALGFRQSNGKAKGPRTRMDPTRVHQLLRTVRIVEGGLLSGSVPDVAVFLVDKVFMDDIISQTKLVAAL